jgi:hypothetical protein
LLYWRLLKSARVVCRFTQRLSKTTIVEFHYGEDFRTTDPAPFGRARLPLL